jgi:hypothetical protein
MRLPAVGVSAEDKKFKTGMTKRVKFDERFWRALVPIVAGIERKSHVEVVVVVRPKASSYQEYALRTSCLLTFIVFSFFRFAPAGFHEDLIYIGTTTVFLLSLLLINTVPSLFRNLIGPNST